MKTRHMGAIRPSAILSRKGIARYGGVSKGIRTQGLQHTQFESNLNLQVRPRADR